ncbi:MAG: helix-turn-helix domain-containing protein [Acidimicrobiia bacterium]|nr:helix-turn-helix domain-containing protein [Acidimicrobiia bacterium]
MIDPLVFGHRVRHYRKRAGMTLDDLGASVGRPAPYLSLLENGKKEPKLSLINELSVALGVPVAELLEAEPPSHRADLEVTIERAQRDQAYRDLGLPYLKPSARIPDVALEHIVALYEELRGRDNAAPFTRDEARAANAQLRAEMTEQGNYFPDVERIAAAAVEAAGFATQGALSKGDLNTLAEYFGFKVIRTPDVPASVRSVTDTRNGKIFVHGRDSYDSKQTRSVILQTLGHFALGHPEPKDFRDFLRQRVEANYFAGAVLVPEATAVPFLSSAKSDRNLSVEDLKDRFFVSYEMAGHRFTNLATRHLGLETHFVRSDDQGIIWKAYENNGVPFPKNSAGAIEGQRLCREWGTRQAFSSDARYTIHYQYTDTPSGSYWCATFVETAREPASAITVGVRFEDAKWFRGWNTERRSVSRCPDGDCCRHVSERMVDQWFGQARASVRPNSHMLAAMPVETLPGVDMVEIYEFLTRQENEAFQ